MVKVSGRFTSPWISSRCWSGSMSGVPEWLRSKCTPLLHPARHRERLGHRGRGTRACRDRAGEHGLLQKDAPVQNAVAGGVLGLLAFGVLAHGSSFSFFGLLNP